MTTLNTLYGRTQYLLTKSSTPDLGQLKTPNFPQTLSPTLEHLGGLSMHLSPEPG